jgi:hypothetical protein
VFYGCNRYPECNFAAWDKPTDKICETCGYPMGERNFKGRVTGYRCLNKECPTVAVNGKSSAGDVEALPSVTEARATRAAPRSKAAAAKKTAVKKAASAKKTTTSRTRAS